MKFSASEAQAFLAAIVGSSDDAIISKDLNGNITSWNRGAEKIFGYPAGEAIGKHISIIIPQDRLEEEEYILNGIKAGKRPEHFEAIRQTRKGKLLNLSLTVSPIIDSKGQVIGTSTVARDVTGLREAERASAYLSAIVELSDDAIISKDLNGFITSWNKSAERIFGYTAEEMVGRHITLIIPSERLSEEDEILSKLRAGQRIDHFETLRRHKNGRLIPISITVSPIRDGTGKLIGASKIARDISERVEAEVSLKEMSRKKDEFLANMSHELRTPMNAVIGLANILLRSDTLSDKDRKYVDTLKISADNLMELINDLLDFSKIEADIIELEEIEFNLAEQVERAISVTNVRAREKNLSFYVDYNTSLSRCFTGDPLRIHQILLNLLSNAVKFTEKGSVEVEITGKPLQEADAMQVMIRVSDTGIGIPENKLAGIFEKFSQADSSITRRYGGTGLGLAITKALVEKMKGTIDVESELGIGTTFTVMLPLRNAVAQSSVESFSAIAATGLPRTTSQILLVEDYEPNVLVASVMLEQLGYRYEVARNGLEALRKFTHGTYDVILMDVQMAELDGLETTRRMRKLEVEKALTPTPIIAMTAHVKDQDRDKCLEAGMDGFIPKPFEPAMLAQMLAKYVPQDGGSREFRMVASRDLQNRKPQG